METARKLAVTRLALVWLLVCSVGFVAGVPTGVVDAQEVDCIEDIPSLPNPVASAGSMAFAGGVLTAIPELTAPAVPAAGGGPILTGGSAITGGTPVGLAALMIAGSFTASYLGTCYFLDAINADKVIADGVCTAGGWVGINFGGGCSAPQEAAQGVADTTWGALSNYSSFDRVRTLTLASPLPDFAVNPLYARVIRPDETLSRGSVAWPGNRDLSAYDVPVEADRTQASQYLDPAGDTAFLHLSRPWPALFDAVNRFTGPSSITIRIDCMVTYDPAGGTTYTTNAANVGGVCGQPPGQSLAVVTGGGSPEVLPSVVTTFFAEANAGWSRHYVTDTRCYNTTSGALTWRRYSGAYFVDKGTEIARPSVGRCVTGEVAGRTLITKVPSGVTCNSGVVCWPGSLVADLQLPTEWLSTGTAPDWIECLSVGNTCGAVPSLDTGTDPEDPEDDSCSWGSVTVDLTFCNEPQVEIGQTVDGGLETVETVEVVDVPEVPASTGTPIPVLDIIVDPATPPVPPETTTGIDTGTNAPVCQGVALQAAQLLLNNGWSPAQIIAQIGCNPDEDSGVCFPSGWGLFNPVEWVVKPVKCVLIWAFVPDDLQGWSADQWEKMESEVPFSYIAAVVGFMDTLTDLEGASGVTELCHDYQLPEFDDGTTVVGGGTTEACLDISEAATVAQGTPLLAGLLQWSLVGWWLWKWMLSIVRAVL